MRHATLLRRDTVFPVTSPLLAGSVALDMSRFASGAAPTRAVVILLATSALDCGSITAGDTSGRADDAGAGGAEGVDGGLAPDARLPVDEDPTPLPPWESLIDPARLHQVRITVAASDVPTLETLHGP